MAGFAFKTGHKGTGYYQDALPTAPEASSNDHEPPRDGTDDDAGGPTSRADRKRDENGKRLRKRTRKKMANTATDTPFVCQEGDIDQDRWWVQYGWWAIDSVNPNSWTTAKAKVLNLSSADAIGMQETKVEGEEKISDAKRHARDLGWNSTFTGAKSTPAQRASGGCAVCARKGTGVSDKGSVEIDDKVRHRVCHAWVNGVVKGGLHVFSVYAKDLIGPVGENLKLLEELVAATRAVSGPWIITADWNMTPEALSATGWPRMIGGCIVAPSLPTCNEEVYDFFVVSEGLRHAVKGIQRIKGAGLQPHFPVRIFISGNARRLAVRKLVKAQRVHGTLPHGPANKPADFSGVHDAARKGDVTQAMTRWYKLARAEWSSLTGRNLEHRRHRFAWASAVGRVADPNAGTSFAARLWRYAATTAKEAQQALGNKGREGYAQRRRALEGHLNDVVTRAQGDLKSMDHGQKEAVQKWSESLTAALTAESIPWCASLSKVAGKRAEKMEAETMRRKQAAWRTMLGNGSSMEGGTGVPTRTAYRWVKGICGWTSSAVGPDVQSEAAFKEEPDDPDAYEDDWSTSDNFLRILKASKNSGTIAPAADQVTVEREAEEWAKWWQVQATYDDPFERLENREQADTDRNELAPLTVADIRMAAKSFPIGTGVGVDNVSPRALDRLSDEAIEALISVLHACERTGKWGECNALVMIVLLPKADGGVRPIGLLPTTVRVWMRARVGVARRWEEKNADPCFFGGKGMGAQKAAWKVAYRAEVANTVADEHVQALLDMTKAFETIPHAKLVHTAKKYGYNLALLRLSIAAYRMGRTIGIDGAQSGVLRATRGITAGSGFATTELRILMQEVVLLTLADWGTSVGLTLYVDDLTIETRGDIVGAAGRCAAAVDFICEMLEKDMGFIISEKKSVVVASHPMAAIAAANASSQARITAVKVAKLLGTATRAGAHRAVNLLKVRTHQFKKRCAKFQALRKMGVNTAAMAQAAAASTMTYGAECIGISDSMLMDMRRITAKICVGAAEGKSPIRSLYAVDGAHGTIDPAFAAHSAPITMWAQAWWGEWDSPAQLDATFAATKLALNSAKGSTWSKVKGPVAAVIATAHRLQWTWTSSHVVVDDAGTEWNLMVDPPAAIKKAVKRSVRRWRLRQIANETPGLVPQTPDITAAGKKTGDTRSRTVLVDCAASALTSLSKKKANSHDKGDWESKHKPYLVSAIAGGQWTQTRKARVTSWNILDKKCQLCNEEDGTLAHRFTCRATCPPGGRAPPPKQAKFAMARLGERRKEILRLQGIVCANVPVDEKPAEGSFRWISDPPDTTREDLVWYTDGSCSNPNCLEVARFGFAIVVVSSDGELIAYGAGVPPAFVTDSGMAEIWALHVVLAETPFIPRVVTDYLGVISVAKTGTAAATAASSANARLWKMIAHQLDGDITQLSSRVVWMPAHQTAAVIGTRLKSDNRTVTSLDFRANRLVDKLALHFAAQSQEAKWGEVMVSSTKAAAKHALMAFGKVTFEANNHKIEVVGDDGVKRHKTVRDSQSAPELKKKARKKETITPTVVETFTADEIKRLLEKLSSLDRDQKKFGRRKLGAKRATPVASTVTMHPAGFKEFVEDKPVKLGALAKLNATARLCEAAAAATKQAEEEAHEEQKEKQLPAFAFLKSDVDTKLPCISCHNVECTCVHASCVLSEPSRTPLERIAIFDGDRRMRPTRTSRPTGSHRESDRAVYSLLHGPR